MSGGSSEFAWILHVRPWRDTSLLCELFTREHGRIGVLARGVRGKKAGRRALLQVFQPLLVAWRGRGELPALTHVELAGVAPRLSGDALYAGFYVNELLCRLLPRQQPQPGELFRLYQETLSLLDAGQLAVALRRFEKRLLEHLGYAYRFDRLADSAEPLHPDARYRFQAGAGVLPCPEGETGFAAQAFETLAREDWRDEWLADHRRILQAALEPLLGGRPLRSRTVYGAMKRLAGGGLNGMNRAGCEPVSPPGKDG